MEKECLSILVIDPRKSEHQLIRDSLKRSKVPARLRFVGSSAEGLKETDKNNFDLILTDHLLPTTNAFTLLMELQQKNLTIPVIVLTHDDEARVAREAFQRGADDYLLKEELSTISLFDVISDVIEKRGKKEDEIQRALLLREQAERDGLTGLYNHRFFVEALEREFARSKRYRRPLSLLMMDLDGFKAINDTCGHQQGDRLLKQIATLLIQSVRFVDLAARYGGDEFALILPETDLREALRMGQRLLREIRNNPCLFDDKIFQLSASIGIAGCHPGHATAGALLKEADRALYEAKRKGRNQVVLLGKSLKAKDTDALPSVQEIH